MLDKTRKIYHELFDIIDKNRENLFFSDYDLERLREQSEAHCFGLELKEKHGFNIDPKEIKSLNYIELESPCYDSYIYLRRWSKNMKISWSDDGSQPSENEFLLDICFSAGAYIFGDYYPKELFVDFFNELKSYNPKYSDTNNKTLYFSMDNAAEFYNDFPKIWNRYTDLNKENFKKYKAEKLRKELKELEDK